MCAAHRAANTRRIRAANSRVRSSSAQRMQRIAERTGAAVSAKRIGAQIYRENDLYRVLIYKDGKYE